MYRRLSGFFLIFLLLFPAVTKASMAQEYIPPMESDYYKKKISWKLYVPAQVVKLKITQYSPMPEQRVVQVVEWNVKENSFIWVDMTCAGNTLFQYYNQAGELIHYHMRGESLEYLGQGSCSGNTIQPSDYNEQENRYASDTFGGTQEPLDNPPYPDGSGGDGETGYIPPDGDDGGGDGDGDGDGDDGDGGDGGDGSDGDGSGGDGGNCCCPGWDEYMDKIDEIIGKIPDWGEIIGEAPDPPDPPAKPSLPDDRGIDEKEPQPIDNPDLGDAADDLTPDDIKDGEPIDERDDPTDGFDLDDDPIDSLPDLPGDELPKPGETDPGEWGENKPKEPENPFPDPPEDKGGDVENPPKPGDDGGDPPKPGDDGGDPPTPGDNGGDPPIPGDGGDPPIPGGDDGGGGMKYYKPSPDAPDGSGGDWNP